ncbi:MAG: protein kinase [Polyangiaceae bacterium]
MRCCRCWARAAWARSFGRGMWSWRRLVALRCCGASSSRSPAWWSGFAGRWKLARRVTHRNVARVFDIGEHHGEKFLTMELLDGEPLSERMRRAPLSWSEAVRICIAVVEGLAAAHAAGVVHRDLKPDNVLLTRDERVVITDFGIARARFEEGDALRTAGVAVGTPAYMAPEQIEPEQQVDARADIYAFGAVMFELFTGRRAWPGDNPIAVAAARVLQPPPDPCAIRPELPEAYAAIIRCCLARRAADRYPSAEALANALRVPSPWLVDEPEGAATGYDLRTAPTLVQLGSPEDGAPGGEPSVIVEAGSLVFASVEGAVVGASGAAGAASSGAMSSGVAAAASSGAGVVSSGAGVVSSGAGSSSASGGGASGADGSRRPRSGVVPVSSAVSTPPRSPRASPTLASPAPAMSVVSPTPRAAIAPPPPAPSEAPSASSSSPGASSAAPSAPKTVAVLPFRNTGGADDEYLADGLTDEMIDTLSMTPGLRVRSRGVVMQHKGADADPREIGAALDVGLVVEGSIRRTPSGVRITARVVSVRDGSQLWAKRFDKPTVDVFEVSDEVARAVAEALTLEQAAPPAREAPADPVAMDLYLRARQEYRKYWPDNVRRAVAMFEDALARSPDNPTMLSAYALACARLWWFGGPEGSRSGAQARQAAERALAAAPHLGEPHLALAQVMWNSADALGAARALERAIVRAPTLAEAHALRGRVLVEAGRLEAGVKSLTTAITLEPNVPLAVGELARAYAFLGRWDELPALAEKNAETEGPQALWFMRARFALWRRDRVTARRYADELSKDPQRVLAVARWIFDQVLTETPPADTIDLSFFVAGEDASARRRSFIYQIEAEVRAFHGQVEPAMASVERSVAEGLFDLAWLDRCPLLAPLASHIRFQASRAIVEDRVRAVLAETGVR